MRILNQAFILCLILAGCLERSESVSSRSSQNTASEKDLIIESSIKIERSENLTSATLSFKTKEKSICRVLLLLNGEQKKKLECPEKLKTSHTVAINDLRPDEKFVWEIRAWRTEQSEKHAHVIRVDEPPFKLPDSSTQPSGDNPAVSHIGIIQHDSYSRTTHLQLLSPSAADSVDSLWTSLTTFTGCQNKVMKVGEILPKANNVTSEITNLSQSGYAFGKAYHRGNLVIFEHQMLQPASPWNMSFHMAQKDYMIRLPVTAKFSSVKFSNTQTEFRNEFPEESQVTHKYSEKDVLSIDFTTQSTSQVTQRSLILEVAIKSTTTNTRIVCRQSVDADGVVAIPGIMEQLAKGDYLVVSQVFEYSRFTDQLIPSTTWILSGVDSKFSRFSRI